MLDDDIPGACGCTMAGGFRIADLLFENKIGLWPTQKACSINPRNGELAIDLLIPIVEDMGIVEDRET